MLPQERVVVGDTEVLRQRGAACSRCVPWGVVRRGKSSEASKAPGAAETQVPVLGRGEHASRLSPMRSPGCQTARCRPPPQSAPPTHPAGSPLQQGNMGHGVLGAASWRGTLCVGGERAQVEAEPQPARVSWRRRELATSPLTRLVPKDGILRGVAARGEAPAAGRGMAEARGGRGQPGRRADIRTLLPTPCTLLLCRAPGWHLSSGGARASDARKAGARCHCRTLPSKPSSTRRLPVPLLQHAGAVEVGQVGILAHKLQLLGFCHVGGPGGEVQQALQDVLARLAPAGRLLSTGMDTCAGRGSREASGPAEGGGGCHTRWWRCFWGGGEFGRRAASCPLGSSSGGAGRHARAAVLRLAPQAAPAAAASRRAGEPHLMKQTSHSATTRAVAVSVTLTAPSGLM